VHANLLRKWVKDYQHSAGAEDKALAKAPRPDVFVVVQSAQIVPHNLAESTEPGNGSLSCACGSRRPVRAYLPDGVCIELDAEAVDVARLTTIIDALGRYHVPLDAELRAYLRREAIDFRGRH
jgi:transposase-like protein